MTLSAHDIAAELRRRMPGLGQVKLHKLLYYCQGHHVAHFDVPLYGERIAAWDMGPVVEAVWRAEKYAEPVPDPVEITDNGVLNTIGYVLSRYGSATGSDLKHMTHGETPWQLANATRYPGTSAEIRLEWMRDYFSGEGAPTDDSDGMPLDSTVLRAWLAESAARPSPGIPDDLDRIRAWATRDA